MYMKNYVYNMFASYYSSANVHIAYSSLMKCLFCNAHLGSDWSESTADEPYHFLEPRYDLRCPSFTDWGESWILDSKEIFAWWTMREKTAGVCQGRSRR